MTRHLDPRHVPTMRTWSEPAPHLTEGMAHDASVDCGWGRLIFGQTFDDPAAVRALLRSERAGRRDICMYLRNPHVVVAEAPHELFIDPSYTYRLWFHRHRPGRSKARGIRVRAVRSREEFEEVNRIQAACGMVTGPVETMWANQRTHTFIYLIAEETATNRIVGTVTGVDHVGAFNDPEGGSSLWCLAVDPSCTLPRVGEILARTLSERFISRQRSYMDLSVMAGNEPAMRLYEKLGFERVPALAVKRKNPINEPLFAAAAPEMDELNPYARILADEARRRGIAVEVIDAPAGYMRMAWGGREVAMRESLSELTTAVAMSMCDDKRMTRDVLSRAGLRVAPGRVATFDGEDSVFLKEHARVVVKPARGEQGAGITVGVEDEAALERALALARRHSADVLIEAFVPGQDLRIVVIDHEVVAAAVRVPAQVVGNGVDTIEALIATQSRRRRAATGGESSIPVDDMTVETVREAGYGLSDVLPDGLTLTVRKTANLHTGGTIHDVTASLHPDLKHTAITASRALNIPVVGLDFMVEAPDRPEYVLIEANERPGLANHEPQPTAQRYIDLLFPSTRGAPDGWAADETAG